MIVTLAGHVDHGKTSLVRLLTGRDTDRLAEEKRRGLTIDLGFAYLEADGTAVGFVDVPGHHRFLHNMVAGVAAMQHALLVIAADDGPMPQSREHLQILELLGLSDGVIAISKCDRVSSERLAAASSEVRALVAGSFLQDAPVFQTSAATGAGVDALRRHLVAVAARHGAMHAPRGFRLAIDRTFVLKGIGLVVTGTVHAGEVRLNDEVQVFPVGSRGRVRDLRVQDRPSTVARCGDRAAINLAGHDNATLRRGHWLCSGAAAGHRCLTVDLQVLDDFPRDVRHWTPVHVYHATSHSTGRLALLERHRLAPGERGLAELVLDLPLLGKRGDRLVLRDQALERTLGGGAVIDNRPPSGRRRSAERLRRIRACAATSADAALETSLAQGPVNVAAFADLWDLPQPELSALLDASGAIACEDHLVSRAIWQQWRDDLLNECLQRHGADPSLQGMQENQFEMPIPPAFRPAILTELTGSGALEQRAGRYRPRRHQVALSDAEQDLLNRLQPLIDRIQPPSTGDVARTLGLPVSHLRSLAAPLVSKGCIVQISDKRLYVPRHLADLAGTAEALSRTTGGFAVGEFRDATGIGRNVAIEVLEYFDARGFTRRQGELRTVVGERSRLPAGLG